jgi:hypothetical protein
MWRHITGVEQPAKKGRMIRSKEKEKQAGRKTATG